MSRLKSRRGRPSRYRKSLKDNPYWEEVKRRVRLRDGHRCRMCGKNYNLEIHHCTYQINGISIVGKELEHLECLVTLCEDCHQKVHQKSG